MIGSKYLLTLVALALGFITAQTIAGHRSSADEVNVGWNYSTLLGNVHLAKWEKQPVQLPAFAKMGITQNFAIKTSFPVGFRNLDLREAFAWGADFIVDSEAAKSREVMYLYEAKNISPNGWFKARKLLAKNKDADEFVFGFAVSMSGIDAPKNLSRISFVGVPVKWSEELADAVELSLINIDESKAFKTGFISSGYVNINHQVLGAQIINSTITTTLKEFESSDPDQPFGPGVKEMYSNVMERANGITFTASIGIKDPDVDVGSIYFVAGKNMSNLLGKHSGKVVTNRTAWPNWD